MKQLHSGETDVEDVCIQTLVKIDVVKTVDPPPPLLFPCFS